MIKIPFPHSCYTGTKCPVGDMSRTSQYYVNICSYYIIIINFVMLIMIFDT